jgi:hypothetical protein
MAAGQILCFKRFQKSASERLSLDFPGCSARSNFFPHYCGVGRLSITEFARQSITGQAVHHRE